jgi:hypothetical protein
LLSLVTFFVDVIRNIPDLTLSLFNRGVQLHCVLSRVLQRLLEVSNLPGKFSLRRTVLSIFLLNFGEVLELNSFSFKNRLFHFLNVLLLFLPKNIIPQFHSMNFLFHLNNFDLTDRWVKGLLSFLLESDFPFPKENLAFSFYYFTEDVSLLVFQLRNLILKLNRFVFKFFELLLEVHFNVEVLVF